MPSYIQTLTSNAVTMVTIPGASGVLPGRITVTMLSGTPVAVGVTTDGSTPVNPSVVGEIDNANEQFIPALLGSQIAFTPLYPGGQPPAQVQVKMIGTGTPTMLVQW